jgi:hypothetical protein
MHQVARDGFSHALKINARNYQDGGDWDWFYEVVKDSWPKVLQDLKEYLETGTKNSFTQDSLSFH